MSTDDNLEVRPIVRKRAATVLVLSVLFIVLLLLVVLEDRLRWLTISACVLVACLLLAVALTDRARAAGRWELRLEEDGVATPGNPKVPWSHIREVVVRPVVGSKAPYQDRNSAVVFVGVEGAEMPSVGSAPRRGPAGALGVSLRKKYGSNLLIIPSATDVSTAEVVQWIESRNAAQVTRKDR